MYHLLVDCVNRAAQKYSKDKNTCQVHICGCAAVLQVCDFNDQKTNVNDVDVV